MVVNAEVAVVQRVHGTSARTFSKDAIALEERLQRLCPPDSELGGFGTPRWRAWSSYRGAVARLVLAAQELNLAENPVKPKIPIHVPFDQLPRLRKNLQKARVPGQRKNPAAFKAKLTAEQIREIRASGEPSRVLAAQFRVSTRTVNRLRQGLAWRNPDPE